MNKDEILKILIRIIGLEEYARTLIVEELTHQDEADKMLRKPGQTGAFSAN